MKIKIVSIVVSMLLIPTSVSSLTYIENNYNDNMIGSIDCPDDFELNAYSGGFTPWSDLYWIHIDNQGSVTYRICYAEDRENADFTDIDQFTLSENEMNQLWNAIIENDFFTLDAKYYNGGVTGGTFANVTILAEGEVYSVQTENIDVNQFDDIIVELNTLTPGDNDLKYNALVNSPPLRPSPPDGPTSVSKGEECFYNISTFDFDGDQVYFYFEWGDETQGEWHGPYENQEESTIAHTWNKKGEYNIQVKAIDDPNGDGDYSDGDETEWSDPLSVTVPKTKQRFITLFPLILGRLINIFPFLDCIFDYSDDSTSSLEIQSQSILQGATGTKIIPNPQDECKFKIKISICLVGSWIDKQPNPATQTGGPIDQLRDRIKQDFESRWNRDQWDKTGPNGKPDGKPDGEPPWTVPCEIWCAEQDPGCVIHFEIEVTQKQNCSQQYKETLLKGGYHVINVNDPPQGVSTVTGLDNDGDGDTDDLPDPGENFNGQGSTTGNWDHNAPSGVFAHECGHLLGLFDQYTEHWNDKNNDNKKDYPEERETKPKNGYNGNIMAETNGYPSQDDINDIWNSQVDFFCKCICCPEQNDTDKPMNNIETPENNSIVSSPLVVYGYASDGIDGSGIATLDYRLDWDGGFYEGGEKEIDPPENSYYYGLGPLDLDPYIDPEDWIKITTYAIDAAGNIGEDSVTVTWIEEEEDTIPPVTEETVGEPNEEGGYVIWPHTPIFLDATDEGGSGVQYIYYEIAWDSNEDGIWDETFTQTVYDDSVEIHVEDYEIFSGIIELRWYAVDNAENVEDMHYQQHYVTGEVEDTIPPVTEKTVGEPNEEDGYMIWTFTPFFLDATDEGGSGVQYIHYEIWWDSDMDDEVDTMMADETIYADSVSFTVGEYGVYHDIVEIRWYAVDNAENIEDMHYQEHYVIG